MGLTVAHARELEVATACLSFLICIVQASQISVQILLPAEDSALCCRVSPAVY